MSPNYKINKSLSINWRHVFYFMLLFVENSKKYINERNSNGSEKNVLSHRKTLRIQNHRYNTSNVANNNNNEQPMRKAPHVGLCKKLNRFRIIQVFFFELPFLMIRKKGI